MYTLDQLKSLESQFGSPMYLFREEDFVNNYKEFVACFKGGAYKEKAALLFMVIDIGFHRDNIKSELCLC